MKKGSITPFCAMCLMLVSSVVFVLLESARIYGLDYFASLKAEAGMDSLCAEYQPLLWEQYGLLMLDGAYGTEHFSEDYLTERLSDLIFRQIKKEDKFLQNGLDLFQIDLMETELEGYALATDQQGKLFLKYVAERMKEELPIGVAYNIYERYQMSYVTQSDNSEFVIKEAIETLQWAKSSKWNEIENKAEEAETEEEKEQAWAERWVFDSSKIRMLEKLLETVSEIKAKGVLNMIIGEPSQLSSRTSKPETYIAERDKKEGTICYTGEDNWYNRLLVLEYLDKYFSCYGDEKDEHYLAYEMEYVLAGKDMEWKNLEAVFEKVLFVREMANMTYLLKDTEKMQQAENLAMAIALLIGENPAVVRVIQAGIISVWAYAESILDMRALVSGEKIPVMKTDGEWTLELLNLLDVFQVDLKAKKCEEGMSYKEYLKLLLLTEQDEKRGCRMLEVMEMSLHKVSDYKNCQMNQMILAIQCQFHFESKPIFFSLMTIGDSYSGGFLFLKEELRSYVP